jgi:hypothetical protein
MIIKTEKITPAMAAPFEAVDTRGHKVLLECHVFEIENN